MKPSVKLKPNIFDLLAALSIAATAILCGVLFWSHLGESRVMQAVISADGEVVEVIELTETRGERSISHNGYTLTLLFDPANGGSVQVVHSDCPGGDCVRTGAIHRAGESIVCLPSRLVISLEGESSAGGVDAVIG